MTETHVWVTHGVVAAASPTLFCHRNLLDEERFVQHLRNRSMPYVPLEQAIMGHGDALTVDDATRAGARAAAIARELGHDVTLFVNPYHVATGRPYFFSQLNVLMDSATALRVRIGGRAWRLTTARDKASLRYALRDLLASSATPTEALHRLRAWLRPLGSDCLDVPSYLRVVRATDLLDLATQGVRVENHGWTHADLAKRTSSQVLEEIERGRAWLHSALGCTSRFFAPPFGTLIPEPNYVRASGGPWLLMTRVLFPGRIGPSIYNRLPLRC